MGLINIFNIQKLRPHINYRFSAEIWPNAAEGDKIKEYTKFQYTVKKITQPVYKLNTENKKVYGNTAYVVPVFKYGETTLEITFEETDTMEVFKQLCTWMGPNLHKGYLPPLINIRITQFNESMIDVVDKKVYVCRLKEHGMPSFNNNGFGSPVEITATFNVVYVMEEPLTLESYNANNEINRYTTEYALPENKALNDALAKSLKDYKNPNSYGYKIFKAEAALANKKIDELTVENSDLNKGMMEQLDLAYAKIMENATDEQRALMQQIAKSKGGITMRNQVENLLNYFNAEARAEQDAKTKESGTSANYELIKFNAADGVDNYETEAVERFLKLTNTDEKTAEEIRNILFKMNENAERIGEFDEAIKKTDIDTLEKGLMKDYKSEDDLNKAIKEAMVSIEAEASKGEPPPTRSSNNNNNNDGTNDFIVTNTELTANLEKIHNEGYANVSMETLKTVSVENAKRMSNAYNGFTSDLSKTEYSASINKYNDPNHEVGIGSKKGSHITGQKVDLTFYKNGKKITINNSTAKDREFLSKIAEQNGLIINWESTGASGSGWGDVALSEAFSINKNGKIEKIKVEPWIKEGNYYDSSAKTAKKFNK